MSNRSNWQKNKSKKVEGVDLGSIQRKRYIPAFSVPLSLEEYQELASYLAKKQMKVYEEGELLENGALEK